MIIDVYYTHHNETWEEKFIWDKEKFIEYINFYIEKKWGKKVTSIKQAEKYFEENFTKEWLEFIIRCETKKE